MSKSTAETLICLVGCGVLMFASFMSGRAENNKAWERDAIKRGYAQYEVDPTGNPVWKWKETEETK